MKIDSVILSCNENPLYLDFWNPVSRIWKERFGIEPVLLFFGNTVSHDLSEEYGRIIPFKTSKDFPEYLQTLWIRYWYPSQEPEKTWMISDIDMIPISKNYFVNQISEVDPCAYVHLYANAKPIPSCYHVAMGSLFQRFLNLPNSFEDSLSRLVRHSQGTNHMGMDKWGMDEYYAHMHLQEYYKMYPDFFKFFTRENADQRIDRSRWSYDEQKLLNEDYYIDSHSIRPYKENQENIDKMISLIMAKGD
jgi:hypothetical protein